MSDVRFFEGSWTVPSCRRTYHYTAWQPERFSARLIILHGFGEHGGRYETVARTLAGQGIGVVVPDLLGHGRSGGPRGDIGSFTQCLSDLHAMTQHVALRQSGHTSFALFGHSFGGLVGILWGLRYPEHLRCLIVQSPLLEVEFPIPSWKTTLAKLLAGSWPAASLPMNLNVTMLSHDPDVVRAYRTDPLVHNRMSARTYCDILHAKDEAFARAASLTIPTLLLCGAQDRIISVDATQRWFAQVPCEKKSIVFPNTYHELHHEPVQHEVLQLIHGWILQHHQSMK